MASEFQWNIISNLFFFNQNHRPQNGKIKNGIKDSDFFLPFWMLSGDKKEKKQQRDVL